MENGGGGLLALYKGSPYSLLRKVYPEYEFLPWRFLVTPRNIWKDLGVLKMAVQFLEKALKMNSRSDWHRVSVNELKSYGLSQLFIQAGGVAEVLKKVYPDG